MENNKNLDVEERAGIGVRTMYSQPVGRVVNNSGKPSEKILGVEYPTFEVVAVTEHPAGLKW